MAVKTLMTDETGLLIAEAIREKAKLEERVYDLEKNKVDKSSIAQTTGTAEDKVMSQEATTEELEKKFDKSNVVQSTGDAEDKVMSQAAATKEFDKFSEEINDVDSVLFERSTNLAALENIMVDTIIKEDGTLESNTNYKTSDYIEVNPNKTYIGKSLVYIGLYDSNKDFLRRVSMPNSVAYTMPANVRYVRISSNIYQGYWQLNEGETLLEYEPYYLVDRIGELEIGEDVLKEQIEETKETLVDVDSVLFERSTNLAALENIMVDTIIKEDGTLESNTNYKTSDYIEVNPNKTYIGKSLVYIGLYDSNKDFLRRVSMPNSVAYTMPANVRYVRISSNVYQGYWQLNEGEILLEYEPYYLVDRVGALDKKVFGKEKSIFYHGEYSPKKNDFGKWYDGMNEYSTATELGWDSKYSDVIIMMDELMNTDPGYVKRATLGTTDGKDDAENIVSNKYTVYEYVFKPKELLSTTITKKHPKILIDACIHGFEKNSFFGWYHFLFDLVNNWESNDALTAIRNSVEIRFIPVVSPWEFDNNTRGNLYGVNINRNFDAPNWVATDESGAEPFDQKETCIVRDWLLANNDALFYFNTHTNGMYNANGYPEMNCCMSYSNVGDVYYDKMFNAFKKHIEKQTMMFEKRYETIKPSDTEFCGREQHGTDYYTETSGLSKIYASYYANIPAMTLEGCNGLVVNGVSILGVLSSTSKKVNSEIFGNMLIQIIEEYMEN